MAQITSNHTHVFSDEPAAADGVGPSSFTPTAHDASSMERLIALSLARSIAY